jgi:hypothetical protein
LAGGDVIAIALTPDLEALVRMGLAVLCGLAVGVNRAHWDPPIFLPTRGAFALGWPNWGLN